MKIFKHSLLLFRINTNKDTVKCVFIFFISWLNWKIEINTIDISKLPMSKVIELFQNIENDYNLKYRI